MDPHVLTRCPEFGSSERERKEREREKERKKRKKERMVFVVGFNIMKKIVYILPLLTNYKWQSTSSSLSHFLHFFLRLKMESERKQKMREERKMKEKIKAKDKRKQKMKERKSVLSSCSFTQGLGWLFLVCNDSLSLSLSFSPSLSCPLSWNITTLFITCLPLNWDLWPEWELNKSQMQSQSSHLLTSYSFSHLIATHKRNGKRTWWYLSRVREDREKREREREEREEREKRERIWCTREEDQLFSSIKFFLVSFESTHFSLKCTQREQVVVF